MTAKDLCIASLTAVKNRDRKGWLALFEEDAVVEDPVGVSALDPTGRGHRGKPAIAKFYDGVITTNKDYDFEIPHAVVCGDEIAALILLQVTGADGRKAAVEAINIYRQSPNGKIASLRSFWAAIG